VRLAGVSLIPAAGANRVLYMGRDRISEAFDKDSAPRPRSIGILVQLEPDDADEPHVVGIGIVGAVAGVASATVRATISPLYALSTPVPISELDSALGDFPIPSRFYAQTLSESTGLVVLATIFDRDPNAHAWLHRQLALLRIYEAGVEQARVEARDAVGLAASIAGISLPSDALSPEPVIEEDEDLLDSIMNRAYQVDLEEELLPLDLLRFDGVLTPDIPAASMSVFRDANQGIRLAVFSVNKKPLEIELGVDLIYWDRVHDTFTFVQYKRLERVPSAGPYSEEWVYRRRSELEDQLGLMPIGRRGPASSVDWRMTDTPFWFKFVRGDAARRPDNKVLKGMYVPADWLRLAMDEPLLNAGPKGGFRVAYDNTKYVGRGTFVQLVSRGLIGTTTSQSADFKPVIESLGKDRQLIIAVKDVWNRDGDEAAGFVSDPSLPF
jgi:hypothetical protein